MQGPTAGLGKLAEEPMYVWRRDPKASKSEDAEKILMIQFVD